VHQAEFRSDCECNVCWVLIVFIESPTSALIDKCRPSHCTKLIYIQS
jgi:hypothetical protein